jgi:hypothetical protein
MARGDKIGGHGLAHDAKADETDFAHGRELRGAFYD